MNRRSFLALAIAATVCPVALGGRLKKYVFRVKTKGGSIVGNILIEANDEEAAKVKLKRRYPDCQILNVGKRR